MKKLLSIAVCASAVAAFATDTPITLGQVGVTAITSSYTNTVVAVSYKELGDGDGNITISNIVKTANLEVDDLLYVFKDGSVMFCLYCFVVYFRRTHPPYAKGS